MNIAALVAVLLAFTSGTYGLDCHVCGAGTYDGETGATALNCFSRTGQTASTCTGSTTAGVITYCRTQLTMEDGIVTALNRTCVNSDSTDVGADTGTNVCVSTPSTGNPVDTTTCNYHCTTDGCNAETFAGYQPCSSDCGAIAHHGVCNYLTGQCVCNGGRTGTSCETLPTTTSLRKCIQCDSRTDTNCDSLTTAIAAIDCPDQETRCTAARTSIIDRSGNIIGDPVTTRGCITVGSTANSVTDECRFTDIRGDDGIISSGYRELTCVSICDTDDCNKNKPNGVVDGTEAKSLECVVCDDATSCPTKTVRTLCPVGTTHCKATVTYLLVDTADRLYDVEPVYDILNAKRECATAAVTTGCTESTTTPAATGIKKITCQETCQTDGCNDDWPARPHCIQCASIMSDQEDGYDKCEENPPEPTRCDHPYHQYCVIMHEGLEMGKTDSVPGYPRKITRDCSYIDIGTGCSASTLRQTAIESCNLTCSTDGCNVGSGSVMHLQTIVAVAVPALLGWMAQRQM